MFSKPFKINSKDFTKWVHKYGIESSYEAIEGLPQKYTNDGTLHDDVIANKATFRVSFNPMPEDVARDILTEYRAREMFITILDSSVGMRTLLVKPATANIRPVLERRGEIIYYHLSDLVFREK